MSQDQLLDDVLAFIATHGIAESTFGRDAVSDWAFIRDIRGDGGKRRRVWPETEAKVRRYMATYRPEQAAA